MTAMTIDKSQSVTHLLNGTMISIKNVIPISHNPSKPTIIKNPLNIQYGVLIGITGDIKGNLVLSGEMSVFEKIGSTMFGMPIDSEMLVSFSGELGNMIAGGVSTNIIEHGLKTDISAPTILEGNTTLSGYGLALSLPIKFESIGELQIFILLD